jgi:hypothetical protein
MILDLFYIIGLFILVMSFSNMINFFKFNNIKEWAITYKKVTGNDIDKNDFRKKEDYNIFTIYSLFIFIEIVWFLFGLITSDYRTFLLILIFNIINMTFNKFFKVNFFTKIIGFFICVINFSSILFLILNHFHFHIQVLGLF